MNRKFLKILVLLSFVAFTKTKSSTSEAILTLIKETKNSVASFINFNGSFINDLVAEPERKFALQLFEVEKIKKAPNETMNLVIMNISSMDNFEKFIMKINIETFTYNGHFIILAEKDIQMEQIFKKLWMLWIYNVNILLEGIDNILMYTFMPFSNNSCNNTKPIFINSFDTKKRQWISSNFFPKKFKNLQGCELKVGGFESEPAFIVNENKNGSVSYSGINVDVIRALGTLINFVPKIYEREHIIGTFYKNKTATGLLKDVYTNEVDVIIPMMSLQLLRAEHLSETRFIFLDSMILVVPPPFLIDPLRKILMPFTLISWICIGVLILTTCFVVILLKFLPSEYHNYIIGRDVKGSILNVWNLVLGGSQSKLPSTNFPRFLLINFILFSFVIRILYESAIFNLLKEDISTIELNTIDEFIEHDFTFVVYESLAARSNGSKFMKNHITVKIEDQEKYFFKTLNPNYKGVVFEYLSMILYRNIQNRGNYTFRICKEAMLTNQIVLYFTKNFYLVDEVNRLIEEMKAAGLIDHIISKYINLQSINEKDQQKIPTALNFHHFQASFQLLGLGLAFALLSFALEISGNFCFKRKRSRLRHKWHVIVKVISWKPRNVNQ